MIQLKLNNLLLIDLEINPKNQQIFKVGALLIKNFGQPNMIREEFEQDTRSKTDLESALKTVSEMANNADCLIGHNIIHHDLPELQLIYPELNIFELPVIDTLQLSPLAFPKNPYHRLLKDYKLIRNELNSPLQDCEATLILFTEQLQAFREFSQTNMDELRCYQTILAHENPTYAALLSIITNAPNLITDEFNHLLPEVLRNFNPNIKITHKVCMTELNNLLEHKVLFDREVAFPFLYTLSWLRVSGDNSVLAPWVRHQFPETSELIEMLRENNCKEDDCSYCSTVHNPQKELQRYFGFNDFRYENIEKNESIQRDIIEIGMRDENVFAILPTGGGKSLCYQLPALNRFFRNGSLTIIISPLQALMKDQVDGLVTKYNIHNVATLNGSLSQPERADVLEKLQMGDIGLLFVSPEQFRSSRFKRVIEHRQIGAWIYDEAHCLSKWGNDFRPDYLYVAKCILELANNQPIPAIGCFTATAKQEVINDIKQHFKEILDVEFTDKISLKERENLSFEIIPCQKHEKISTITQLLSEHIDHKGGAIIFVSRRKTAEDIALKLQAQHWNCQHFHAGLPANEKKDIQNAFIAGDIQIIVSTNAFGMGVDKDNVRLVIHSDIPGSLENYLQEAGRAGRDQYDAKCILLYEDNDLEAQFRLSEFSKLTQQDIQAIYKKIRSEKSKRKNSDLVITAKEILKDALVQTIDIDDDNAETKVITAIAWLERGGYLERKDNVITIFPAHLKKSLSNALEIIQQAGLSQRKTQEFTSIVEHIAKTPANKIIEVDTLAELIAGDAGDIEDILTQLQILGILTNDTLLTAYVRHGIKDTTQKRLAFSLWCENELLSLLEESAPDIESGEWRTLNLTLLCNALNQNFEDEELKSSLTNYLVNGKIMPGYISQIIKTLTEDKSIQPDTKLLGHMKIIEVRNGQKDTLLIKINGNHSWQDIRDNGENRRIISKKILTNLLEKVQGSGKDLLVETTFETLQNSVFSDMMLAEQYQLPDQQKKIIQNTLLYMHNLQMLTLNHGMTVMRKALTIAVDTERQNRYLVKDYELLKTHYKERRLQIHVMGEYAELGMVKLEEGMRYVLDYFSLKEPVFIQKYFQGREKILALATSEDSWRKIVENLNDIQRKIVESDDKNRLILAGPGSGKTRVIVHRIAYLLRVQRVPAHAIIALAYNRAAANEIRKRLYELVGNESYGVTVMTYHGIAMRLTGTVYQYDQQNVTEADIQNHFKTMLQDAIEMLRGNDDDLDIYDDEDDSRSKLLRGYRYILVDEYQDIDEDQYQLISALAGRQEDEDGKLSILAVGDDDQNIYTFRGSSNQYIDQFTEDYGATIDYLVENYRSTQAIIQASNDVIEHNPDRLKSAYPITIDRNRLGDNFYGDWETMDPKRAGQIIVRILQHKDYQTQAHIVIHEIIRLAKIDSNVLNSCAILSRSKNALECFSGGLTEQQIPFYYEDDQSSHFATASHRYFLRLIQEIRSIQCQNTQDLYAQIRWSDYPERWQLYFKEAFEQLNITLNELNNDMESIIHWLFDYAYEMPISMKKGVFIGTMHSAKGLEFDHVFILDHCENYFEKDNEEERRLYYVGMTRAKQTLMLCSFGEKHSIIQSIRETKDSIIEQEFLNNSLNKRYVILSPKDIYMDYLGQQSSDALQRASLTLSEGSALLVEKSQDGRLSFKHPNTGQIVAKSSKGFQHNHIDLSAIEECYIHSITQRTFKMVKDDYKDRYRCETWEVIQPMMVINLP